MRGLGVTDPAFGSSLKTQTMGLGFQGVNLETSIIHKEVQNCTRSLGIQGPAFGSSMKIQMLGLGVQDLNLETSVTRKGLFSAIKSDKISVPDQ